MNEIRFKRLDELCGKIEDIYRELEELREQEKDCMEMTPINLRGTDKYEVSEILCERIESICSYLEKSFEEFTKLFLEV